MFYNRFRYYDPNGGAYISQDPIGLAGGNPNIYGYVEDTSIWMDVLGLACVTYGKNFMAKFKKHSQQMRVVARRFGIELPRKPKLPATQKAMKDFIQKVVDEGDSKVGPYMTLGDVNWHKLDDGIVISKLDDEFVTFLDHSLGGVAHGWDNIP